MSIQLRPQLLSRYVPSCILLLMISGFLLTTPVQAQQYLTLPSEPLPHPFSTSAVNTPPSAAAAEDCAYDTNHARQCRVHWHQLIISSSVFNAFQNAGNLYTGYWYRWETMHGKWWDRYVNSVEGWRWDRWDDYNPFLDDYVGHPMMGSITDYLWIQNDPKSMRVVQSNTWPYWRRMLRATAFATAYSMEWKFGPLGEEGIGHDGDHLVPDGKLRTNETGWVELVTTPVGGALWTMAEDGLDQHVITHLENVSRNPIALLSYQILSPSRTAANILRFRPPWYRDTRVVKANSFWSDPPGENLVGKTAAPADPASDPAEGAGADAADPTPAAEAASASAAHALSAASAANESSSAVAAAGPGIERPPSGPLEPIWSRPGGVNEFGAWWGLSLWSGHLWGNRESIRYMPLDIRYTRLVSLHDAWSLRYAPEITALAMMDMPNPHPKNYLDHRGRTYGAGFSPAGLQLNLAPSSRVQPYLTSNAGILAYPGPAITTTGPQFLYTADFGAGLQFFRKERQSVSIGYRYQHMAGFSNTLSTDANTFYVAVSRFRTSGYR